MTMNLIEKAGLFMAARCDGQKDKAGADYRLHPLRVANGLQKRGAADWLVVAALLHDLIEDGKATAEELDSLFGPRVAGLVMTLTRQPTESYESYIRRVSLSRAATVVKLADLADNMDPARIALLPESVSWTLLKRYRQAFIILRNAHIGANALNKPAVLG
jgi:(p)ppGpp synthase/HD superfamily hydrolase